MFERVVVMVAYLRAKFHFKIAFFSYGVRGDKGIIKGIRALSVLTPNSKVERQLTTWRRTKWDESQDAENFQIRSCVFTMKHDFYDILVKLQLQS